MENVEGSGREFVLGRDGIGERISSGGGIDVGEDMFGAQQFRIDLGRRQISRTDDEDLGRDVTRRRRLGGFDLGEELVEDPEKRVVILGSENFGDESSSWSEEFGGQLEGREYELDLRESILNPGGSYVGSSIVEYAKPRTMSESIFEFGMRLN